MGTARQRVLRLITFGTVFFSVTLPAAAHAAQVAIDLRIERKPVTLFRGEPRPPHILIEEMVRRVVGQTQATLGVPQGALYRIAATPESDGSYRIDPAGVTLLRDTRVVARITILSPRLSDQQYKALRGQDDYRLVYGFIRGIVEHEEEHVRAFVRYTRKLPSLYAKPPLGEAPVVTPREGEGGADALARYVNDRVREALSARRHAADAEQSKIDHQGRTTRVIFQFRDPVNGKVPRPLVYDTEGKLRVLFAVPRGNPRPPEPRTTHENGR